jgi:predicted ATPase
VRAVTPSPSIETVGVGLPDNTVQNSSLSEREGNTMNDSNAQNVARTTIEAYFGDVDVRPEVLQAAAEAAAWAYRSTLEANRVSIEPRPRTTTEYLRVMSQDLDVDSYAVVVQASTKHLSEHILAGGRP